PLAVMTSAMQYAEDDNVFSAADEKDAVREPPSEHASNFRPASEAWIAKRMRRRRSDCGFDFGEKYLAEPLLLALIPNCGVGDMDLSLDADDGTMAHGRSLACTRAFTSSQGLPASGDSSYSVSAASRDRLSASLNSPRSCHAFPASSSSLAWTSARSSALR